MNYYRARCIRDNDVTIAMIFQLLAKDFSLNRIPLCVQTLKICGRQYELNLLSVQIPNELPYQTRKGTSAEIVAKKNSKSYSLRRVMELKDLELGTQGGSWQRPGRKRSILTLGLPKLVHTSRKMNH